MDYNELFSKLNTPSTPSLENRRDLVKFLKDSVVTLRLHPESTARVAYSIAGLFATDFARNLPEGDPIDEILTIAGELEIDPEDAEHLRNELIEKIDTLR